MEVFDHMPIAAHINGKYLCVHGGISPDLHKLELINKFDRFNEVPMSGMHCDLLWSDPMTESVGAKEEWADNPRDCAYQFGEKPLRKLMSENDGLISVIRAH